MAKLHIMPWPCELHAKRHVNYNIDFKQYFSGVAALSSPLCRQEDAGAAKTAEVFKLH
jgi:hypothetical protein